MQKLLRTSPSAASGPPLFSGNTSLTLPLSNTSFLSLGFRGAAPRIPVKMSSSTAILPQPHPLHRPRNPFSAAAARKLGFTKMPPYSPRPCSCALDNSSNMVPLRAWVVLKESNCYGGGGSHGRAWFATLAMNSGEGSAESSGGGVESEGGGDAAENMKMRVQRRQRSGGSVLVVDEKKTPDLLSIPGVGPRNLQKLVDKGFEGVDKLKQLYKDKFFGKSSVKMVEFLQSSVGIIHKNHAESITTYIKKSVDEEMKETDIKPSHKKRITLCVEGNISVGKTTFLQKIANETLELRDLVEIVPEPIDKWQNIGKDHFNILDAFYAEPERYAYTFQNYVFVTRVMQERESSGGIKPLRLMERSIFSDRMVFVRAVHEAKWMNDMEISIYDSWFDPVVSSLPGLIPDGFIYLRASPDTCLKRMKVRKRAEEGGVSLDYLQGLHEKHESWLFPLETENHGVVSVSKLPNDVDQSLLPTISDRVIYLDGNHMHSSIRKVPALILDCDQDIDFSRDIEAKREYARQVAEFFEFVKKKKEVSATDVGGDASKMNQPQVLLPPDRKNLWMPPLPDSALESLGLTRGMSFMSQ